MLRYFFITLVLIIVVFLTMIQYQYLMLQYHNCEVNVINPLNAIVPVTQYYGPFRLMSYNLNALPLFWSDNAKRLETLSKSFLTDRMNDHDLFAFQEAFSTDYTEGLSSFLTPNGWYVAHPCPASFPYFTHSGLMLASRYKLHDVKCITFDTCSFLDCFATKGALSARINVGEKSIIIVNVHLQDAMWDVTGITRHRQVKLLKENLGYNQSEETVYIGDFILYS